MLFSFITAVIGYSKKCEHNSNDEFCRDDVSLALSSLGLIDSNLLTVMFMVYMYTIYSNINKIKTKKYDNYSLKMLIIFSLISMFICVVTYIFSIVVDSITIADTKGAVGINQDILNLVYIIYMCSIIFLSIVILGPKLYYYNMYVSKSAKVEPL